jgi:hypothetical protein
LIGDMMTNTAPIAAHPKSSQGFRRIMQTLVISSLVAIVFVLAGDSILYGQVSHRQLHSLDELPCEIVQSKDTEFLNAELQSRADVHLWYDRFDVFIDSSYYANNAPELNEYFDLFSARFGLLESVTTWSAERFWDRKLSITVVVSSGCGGGGSAAAGYANIYFPDPLYKEGCANNKPYFEEFDGTPIYGGNPGAFGDYWYLMGATLHEALHAINPLPVLVRSWITEGFSDYHYFNILSDFSDINQETADTYIYQGRLRPGFRWEEYVANDYHDNTGNQNEIQESFGYTITSWMFSMMRDDYSLNWAEFYDILNNNLETLNESYVLGDYFTDTYVIDLFGRASGLDFETETKPIWRYDGPSGPGWGVRHWEDLDWYADLTPDLILSNDSVFVGDTVSAQASIWNNGGVSLDSVSVRFYEGSNLINEQFLDFPCSTMTPVSVDFAAAAGDYVLSVVVDEDSVKIEKSDANNEASATVTFVPWYCGDANADGTANITDAVYLITYIFGGGPAPQPMLAGDANCDGTANITDAVYLINYIFGGGPEPCADC